MCVNLAGVALSAVRASLEMPVNPIPAGPAAPAPVMEWASAVPVPLVSRVRVSTFPPQGLFLPSSFLFPFCFILSSFSAFAPFFFSFSTLTQELGRWVSRWGPCGEMGTRNLSRLSHSACPLQAISVSCCPPAPRIPVSMGATVSLLLASWLSAPAPLVGKVYQLLLLSVTSSATYSILGDAGDPEKESTPHWLCLKKFFFSKLFIIYLAVLRLSCSMWNLVS